MRPGVLRAIVLLALAGCAVGSTERPDVRKKPVSISRCAAEEHTRVIGWPEVAKLRETLETELIVVTYTGCEMRVLEGCHVSGYYEFSPTFVATEAVLDLYDENQVWFRLPLGAAELERELPDTKGGLLRLRSTEVGKLLFQSRGPSFLSEGCEAATHAIYDMSVGAFELTAFAGDGSDGRVVRSAGDLEGCKRSQSDEGKCHFPLVVHLSADLPARR